MKIDLLIKEKYSQLSKGQRIVANYLLDDIKRFGMSTASHIARQVNVSETTVIRLSYALGFESFTEMQKAIQNQYLLREENNKKESVQREEGENYFIQRIVNQDIENLKQMIENLDLKDYWTAVHEIMEADEVRIVGFRASSAPAQWLYLKLGMMRTNVELISNNSTRYPDNLLVNKKDRVLFIVFSFPSYAAEALKIAESAKKQEAKLIAISDRLLSPVSRLADLSFVTKISVESENLIPVSSVMSFLNILTTGIERKYENNISKRVKDLWNIYKAQGYFLE